jgi:hypothetical protein
MNHGGSVGPTSDETSLPRRRDRGFGMGTLGKTRNDPKQLEVLVVMIFLGWFAWFLFWRSFVWEVFPQNLVGGLEAGLVGVAPLALLFFVERQRRILKSARTQTVPSDAKNR